MGRTNMRSITSFDRSLWVFREIWRGFFFHLYWTQCKRDAEAVKDPLVWAAIEQEKFRLTASHSIDPFWFLYDAGVSARPLASILPSSSPY